MRVKSQSRLRFVWGFAIFWNLVSAPATFLGAVPAIREDRAGAWVALIFPIVGAALLLWAVSLSLRWWRFGTSCLEWEGVGPALGDTLRARILAPRLPCDSPVRLTLTCINRVVSGSGNNRSVWEKVVCQDEQTVAPESLEPGPEGAVVPLSFELPLDASPTRQDTPGDTVLWRLEARARLAGVDYEERFEIPVAAAPAGRAESAASFAARTPERPESSRIVVEPAPEGGTQFVIRAGRNVRATLSAGFFALLFCGFTVLFLFLTLRHTSGLFGFVPWMIGIMLVPFSLLIVLIALHTGFLSTRVIASRAGLTIASSVFGLSWSVNVPAAEVGGLKLNVGMQVGMTPYYDLKIARPDARPLTISTMLRDRREAEWLAAEILKAVH